VLVGLATGLGEVALRGVQVFVLGSGIHLSPHVVWMAPLADVALLAVAGALLARLSRRWPTAASPGVALFVFLFLALVGPLVFLPRLHLAAAVLLAGGIAAQTARLLAARLPRPGFIRLMATCMALVVVTLGLGVVGRAAWAERPALAGLGPAPSGAPNVLLVVFDTVRARSLSLYGYSRPTTPALERLAARAVVFEQSYVTSPWTLPSHATMFTGRYPHELSPAWLTALDATHPTIAEIFRGRGYLTAGFTANVAATSYETGLARGFIRYEDYPVSFSMVVKSSWLARAIDTALGWTTGRRRQHPGQRNAEEVNAAFLRWLDASQGRPFLAFLNYLDAHGPYLAPPPFDEKFGPTRRRPPLTDAPLAEQRQWSREQIQVEIDAYAGAIAYVDNQLGRLIEELERRGLVAGTVVVVTSDHGEQFGEHGLFDHANSLYLPVLHVPLLVSFPPRVPDGRRVATPVTLRDLPVTLFDLAGLPGPMPFPGASLAIHWAGSTEAGRSSSPLLAEVRKGINLDPRLPVSRGDMHSLIEEGWHYIRNGDGQEELYDVERDPGELENLAEADGGTLLARFRAELERAGVRAPRSVARGRLTADRLHDGDRHSTGPLPAQILPRERRLSP